MTRKAERIKMRKLAAYRPQNTVSQLRCVNGESLNRTDDDCSVKNLMIRQWMTLAVMIKKPKKRAVR